MIKALVFFAIIFSCLTLQGCAVFVDPEVLPPANITKLAEQQFFYSIFVGGAALILIFFGLKMLMVGNWLGVIPMALGGIIIYFTRYEVISTRSVPGITQEIESIPEKIAADFPDLDPVAIKYLEEAIISLKHGIVRGAAFSLGASSERIIDQLISTFASAIDEETNRTRFESRLNGKSISKKYEEFLKSFSTMNNKPDEKWANELKEIMNQMFQFLRILRNESAHPFSESKVEREMVISQFGQFYKYAGSLHQLMQFFTRNRVKL